MSGLLSRLVGRDPAGVLDYEKAKKLAAAKSPRARRDLAGRADAQPEILYFLADDSDVGVRRAVAANAATPPHAGLLLAADGDVEVRCNLAHRIGRLAPQLDEAERHRIGAVVGDVLDRLARDQLPRVRRIIAEELKEAATVPPALIQRLARDADGGVACPLLEFSPLLDDDVLLEILREAPAPEALAAISRRPTVNAPVSDAVVASGDERAIAALLSNPSAQIREETLDGLVERAERITSWQAPLVRRPTLSPRAVRRLIEFVADSLLAELERRRDLDAETAQAVSAALRRRLEDDSRSPAEAGEDRAVRLHADGALSEEAITGALGSGDRAFVLKALSLLAGLPPEVVSKAVSMGSAKGVTAIAWQAGLGMRTAVQLQLRLARVPPPKVLQARAGTDYPLSENEMRWQIEFFGG
jgi:uncharacterized protein (DUF2336 family)